MVNLTINGKAVSVKEGMTILEAAKKLNIYIPTLCYLEDVYKIGSCRVCVVEVEGAKTLQVSRVTPVSEGMAGQTTPAIRAALGEEFGYPAGTLVTGKMAASLRDMGFDYIFDTNFSADLTILEEGTEFLNRIVGMMYQKDVIDDEKVKELGMHKGINSTFPMITSCSPVWIKYIEHYYPEQLDNLSSCKSPHMMPGALAKSFFANNIDIESEDMYVVSIIPCTAKKYEITRPEMENNGVPNVDAVLTTKEFARMIKEENTREKRMKAIYREDEGKKLRKSHENPDIGKYMKIFWENHWDTYPTNCCIRIIWLEANIKSIAPGFFFD